MDKRYDQAYFDRWYRRGGIGDRARLARKVAHGRRGRRVPPRTPDPHRARHRRRRSRLARAPAETAAGPALSRLRFQRVRGAALQPQPQPAHGALRRFRASAPVRAGRSAGLQRRAALPAHARTRSRPAGPGGVVRRRCVPRNLRARRPRGRRRTRLPESACVVLSQAFRCARLRAGGFAPVAVARVEGAGDGAGNWLSEA